MIEGKLSSIVMVKGEVKTGKSHFAMAGVDSIMLDCTGDSNSKATAMRVYGKEFGDRYFKIKDYEELEKVIADHNDVKWICIDEGKDLRDVYANKYLVENNKKKVFPIPEWALIYNDIKSRLFSKYDGVHNFVVTEGLKDRRVKGKESGEEVITGERIADGLNILPTIADVIVHVGVKEKTEGSPPRVKMVRKIEIIRNRFLDFANEKEWVEEVKSLDDMMNKIIERGVLEKEVFLV